MHSPVRIHASKFTRLLPIFLLMGSVFLIHADAKKTKPSLTTSQPAPKRKEAVKKEVEKKEKAAEKKPKVAVQPCAATQPSTPAERRAARKQKKREWRAKKKQENKVMREMNYEELRARKELYAKDGVKDGTLKYLEKMIPMCNDLEELCVIMLELADLLFDTGQLEKAGKIYKEFSTLYPGNKKIEYAAYKAILCTFYATLDAERDQTKTKDTIELAQQFLARADVFKTHMNDVTNILTTCRKRLLDNELVIYSFYFKRGSYASAHKRLEGIRQEFLSLLPDIEPQLLSYECAVAKKQNNQELVKQKNDELLKKFPTQHQQLLAVSTASHKSFVTRF